MFACEPKSQRALLLALLPLAISTSSAVFAQDTAQRATLEEVIVTAQKRQESLQDAALAVTSMSGDELSNAGVNSVLDMQSLAPSLQVSTALGTARVFIRGIGLTNFAMGGEPSVAYHVDGAVISRPAAQISAFYDIERIEVLRGPQGSLYGRNATGGSINVITRRPTEELSGYGSVNLGNYNRVELEGAINGTVVEDQLLARLSFKTQDRDGFGENQFDGRDIDNEDAESYRLGLSYVGSESFDAFLSLSHYENSTVSDYHMLGPANPAITPPEMAMGGQIATDPRDGNSEVQIGGGNQIDSATLELNWNLADSLALKSLTNYLEFDRNSSTDLNGTPVQFFRNDVFEKEDQFSQELQLTWDGENHSTLFGLYYFNENIEASTNIQGPVAYSNILMRPFIQFYGNLESTSYAAFVNSTWNIDEQWSLTGALRYSKDEKADEGFTLTPPGITIPVEREEDWDAWTPKVTVEYASTPDVMLYATASAGYKAGVMNIGNAGPAVDPENVISYEAGMKSQWLDNRMQVNLAVFNATIEDLQVQRPINGNLITVNAAEATTQGIELETTTLVGDNLTLTFNAAYVDAQFDSFVTANTTFTPGVEEDLKGNPLPNAPELQADIGLAYDLMLDNGWSSQFKIQGLYTDERWFDEFQQDIAYQEATFTVNSNVLITSADAHWTLNLWGRNLTDEFIYSHINITSRPIGHMSTATLQEPRTFGATVGYTF